MNDWQALKNIFVMLLLLGGSLLVSAFLMGTDRASLIIPSPDKTAEDFVAALAAHSYTGAEGALSQDLQNQATLKDLQQIVQSVEASHQGIEQAKGQVSQEKGHQATAEVLVKLWDQQEKKLDFPLIKENGEWKIDSISPLQELTQ